MAIQLSVDLRNARLDVFETVIGTAPKLQLRTGTAPANCAAAATGDLVREIELPSDWMAAASNGSKVLAGTWTNVGTGIAGTVEHYRVLDNTGTTCHEQGTVTITGGGGDLTLDNNVVSDSQVITITTWTKTDGNA